MQRIPHSYGKNKKIIKVELHKAHKFNNERKFKRIFYKICSEDMKETFSSHKNK